jgi:hypothetical protein
MNFYTLRSNGEKIHPFLITIWAVQKEKNRYPQNTEENVIGQGHPGGHQGHQ